MYDYETMKKDLFTDDGQRTFLKVRDNTSRLLDSAGAVRLDKAIGTVGGESWLLLACVDRLVELGEIKEVATTGATQSRVFVR